MSTGTRPAPGTTIHVDVRAELPVGSVVLDAFGVAWQRRGDMTGRTRWHALVGPALRHFARNWIELFAHGPITVLHVTEEVPARAAG